MSPRLAIPLVALVGIVVVACAAAFVVQSSNGTTALIVGVLSAGAVSLIAGRLSVAALVNALEGLGLIAPVAAFTITAALIGPRDGTGSFHEIGAQLIVVLLLALALEARFFGVRNSTERLDFLVPLYVMALLAVGEFYALRSLLTHEPGNAAMVGGAIAAGFAAVSVSALLGPAKPGSPTRQRDDRV